MTAEKYPRSNGTIFFVNIILSNVANIYQCFIFKFFFQVLLMRNVQWFNVFENYFLRPIKEQGKR